MTRLRQLLIALIILLVLCLTGVILFLHTFDFNAYRSELEDTLAKALSRPVHLGAVHLTFEPGPAFSFSDLRIGQDDGDEENLRADRILFKLDILPLFKGEIVLRDILLDHPSFRHRLLPPDSSVPASSSSQPLRPLLDIGVLSQWRAQSLTIVQGRLELLDSRQPGEPILYSLHKADFHLDNFALGKTGNLALRAEGMGHDFAADLSLTGTIGLPEQAEAWRDSAIQLTLNLTELEAEAVKAFFPQKTASFTASGQTSLRLESRGSLGAGLDFRVHLEGDNFSLRSPAFQANGKDFLPLILAGRWQTKGDTQVFNGLQLDGGPLHLQGEARLEADEGGLQLRTLWSGAPISITAIKPFLPAGEKGARIASLLQGGNVELASLDVTARLGDTKAADQRFRVHNARLNIRDGQLRLLPNLEMTGLAGQIDLQNDEAAIEVAANTAGHAFRLEGTLSSPLAAPSRLSLQAAGAIDATWLKSALPALREHAAALKGAVPFSISAQGPWQDLGIDLRATLDDLAIDWPRVLATSAKTDSQLALSLQRRPTEITLVQGNLSFPALQLDLTGGIKMEKDRPYHLDIHGKAEDLTELPAYLPFLTWLKPRGSAVFDLQLAGDRHGMHFQGGEAVVQDVGIHLTRVIPDLNAISGRIRLFPDYALGQNLSLKLGESPLVADARLHRYDEFLLQVDVRGDAVRAQDIIFPSEVAVLHDITGRLHFDKEGMEFAPVDVRLAQGTEARVNGRIHWKGIPRVRLDIASPNAYIDEVIALWQDGLGDEEDKAEIEDGTPKKRQPVQVDIKARAAQGSIGNLQFTDAEGDIWLKDRILGISPIRFHAKDGYGIGQVLVDSGQGSPSLLRISGHLENFDAASIYQEMLEHRGLVTGTMRSDFYLEGRAGKEFLASSSGGINLEIKKGVLRQLKTLSRVFSLINVSQILSLRLPDMAEEGMPFNELRASISLDQGVLSTEDLFIDSNAMNLSLVGRHSLIDDQLDLTLGIKPLGTVDKIVSNIPLAGWLLTGEDKALITAQFKIEGSGKDPEVSAIPITSVSDTVLGIFKRTLGLPGKLITDLESLGTLDREAAPEEKKSQP